MNNSKTLPEGKLDADLLERLISELPTDESITIKPGTGFDSAGIKLDTDRIAVSTDPITFTAQNLGIYSVAVNINDIVCQGCRPRWYTASFMLPPDTTKEQLKTHWKNLVESLKKWNVNAAGGHTEVTDAVNRPLLCGQIIGEPVEDKLLDPKNIRESHYLYQWRPAALEGLALIAEEHENKLAGFLTEEEIKNMKNLLERPGICVWPEAEKLLGIDGLIALHDPTEGGIATAAHELAEACGLGLEIEKENLNWPPGGLKLTGKLNIDPLGLLSSGCLLAAVNEELETPGKLSLAKIGKFNGSGEKILVDNDDKTEPLPRYNQDQLLQI